MPPLLLLRGRSRQAVHIWQGSDASALVFKGVSFVPGVVVDLAGSLEPAVLHSLKWEAISASARCSHFCASIKYFHYGWGRTPPTDGTENPWRDSVEHFHCKRPASTSTAYSASCERVIMIMRQNYFLDLLAVDSPSASSSGNTSSTLEHDPEKWVTGFPSGQTRSVCPEIMLKQKIRAG